MTNVRIDYDFLYGLVSFCSLSVDVFIFILFFILYLDAIQKSVITNNEAGQPISF
jgi:hypothetical protein